MVNLIKIALSAIPIYLIYYVTASLFGLDYTNFKIFLFTLIILGMGVFYGIMITIKVPSEEFVKDCMEYEKECE